MLSLEQVKNQIITVFSHDQSVSADALITSILDEFDSDGFKLEQGIHLSTQLIKKSFPIELDFLDGLLSLELESSNERSYSLNIDFSVDKEQFHFELIVHNITVQAAVTANITTIIDESEVLCFCLNTDLCFNLDSAEPSKLNTDFINVDHQAHTEIDEYPVDDFYGYMDHYLSAQKNSRLPEFRFLNGLITLQADDLNAKLMGEDAGLYINYCHLVFLEGNSFLPELSIKNASITKEGFSGVAELDFDGKSKFYYEGFGLELSNLSLRIKNNHIESDSFNSEATLILPGFDPVAIWDETATLSDEIAETEAESNDDSQTQLEENSELSTKSGTNTSAELSTKESAEPSEETPQTEAGILASVESFSNALPIKFGLISTDAKTGIGIELASEVSPMTLGPFSFCIDDFSLQLIPNYIICTIGGSIYSTDNPSTKADVALSISDESCTFELASNLNFSFFEQDLHIDSGACLVIDVNGLNVPPSVFSGSLLLADELTLSIKKDEDQSSVLACISTRDNMQVDIGEYQFTFTSFSLEFDSQGIVWEQLQVAGGISGNGIEQSISKINDTSYIGFNEQNNVDMPCIIIADVLELKLQTLGLDLSAKKLTDSLFIQGSVSLVDNDDCQLAYRYQEGNGCISLESESANILIWGMALSLEKGAQLIVTNNDLNFNASNFDAKALIQDFDFYFQLNKKANQSLTASINKVNEAIDIFGCSFTLSSCSIDINEQGFVASTLEAIGEVKIGDCILPIASFEANATKLLGGHFYDVPIATRSFSLLDFISVQINSLAVDLSANTPSSFLALSGEVSTLFATGSQTDFKTGFELCGNDKSIEIKGETGVISFELMGLQGVLSDIVLNFDDNWLPNLTKLEGTLSIMGTDGDSMSAKLDYNQANSAISFATSGTKKIVLEVCTIILSNISIVYKQKNDALDTKEGWTLQLTASIANHFNLPGIDDFIPSDIRLIGMAFGANVQFGDVEIEWKGVTKELLTDQYNSLKQNIGSFAYLDGLKYSEPANEAEILEVNVEFVGASFDLGPVKASIEGLGFSLKAGKLKPKDLEGPRAKFSIGDYSLATCLNGPSGLSVAIDAPAVSGGGLLYSNYDVHQGFLTIRMFDRVELMALGILSLKNNQFSFVIIMSAEFAPAIPLGLNFYLTGLGGVIGYNRSMNTDKMLLATKDGSIDHVLFPDKPQDNIAGILKNIGVFFPAKQQQFLIGPMAKIEWNQPAILSIKMGVLIEAPDPFRTVILGVMSALLPKPDKPLITLNVAFLGIIDFDKECLSFDAAIFDSKLLNYSLLGDMCLRLSWNKQKALVLSVGGFHPAYQVPTFLNVPKMNRMTLNLLTGNPRLTLTSYFAVTSNTVQFGAGVDFYFKKSKFKVVGDFGYDVLFQFDPFAFIAAVRARLALKWGSRTLMSLGLKFALSGPTPWNATGYAKFSIFWCSYKARFNKTWGTEPEYLPEFIALWPLLKQELERNNNWQVVSINDLDVQLLPTLKAELNLLQPDGQIHFNQDVLPLNYHLDKFGQYRIGDYSKFDIAMAAIGDINDKPKSLESDFAPAHFKNMSDEDKLSASGFIKHNSGFIVSDNNGALYEKKAIEEVNCEFELIVYKDEQANAHKQHLSKAKSIVIPFVGSERDLKQLACNGAISRSKKALKKRRMAKNRGVFVELKQETFSIVFADDHSLFQAMDTIKLEQSSYHGLSFSKAKESLYELEIKLPALKGELMLLADNKQ